MDRAHARRLLWRRILSSTLLAFGGLVVAAWCCAQPPAAVAAPTTTAPMVRFAAVPSPTPTPAPTRAPASAPTPQTPWVRAPLYGHGGVAPLLAGVERRDDDTCALCGDKTRSESIRAQLRAARGSLRSCAAARPNAVLTRVGWSIDARGRVWRVDINDDDDGALAACVARVVRGMRFVHERSEHGNTTEVRFPFLVLPSAEAIDL